MSQHTYTRHNWLGWDDWTTDERIVFSTTVSLKAVTPTYRFEEANLVTGITQPEWDAAVQGLIARGIFNGRGAVKPEHKRAYYDRPDAIQHDVPSVSQLCAGTGKEPWK